MTNDERLSVDQHEQIWQLLPWYLNGSLDTLEQVLVDQHMQVCVACRAEVKAQRNFATLIRAADVDDLAARQAFRDLDSRISGGAGAPRVTWSGRWGRRLRALLSAEFGAQQRFGLAAVLVLAIAGGAWFAALHDVVSVRPREYRTLTANPAGNDTVSKDARIVFSKDATIDAIHATLQAVGASIVSGPSRNGVFYIQFENAAPRSDRAALLQRLRAEPHVLFAEPTTDQ